MCLPLMLGDAAAELDDLAAELRLIEPHLVRLATVRPDLSAGLQAMDRTLQRIDALSRLMRTASGETPALELPASTDWLRNLRFAAFADRFSQAGPAAGPEPDPVELF